MRRPAFLSLSLVGLAAAVPAGAGAGLKIVAQETLPTQVVVTTEYIQPDRSRVESRVVPRSARGASETPMTSEVYEHGAARIVRCDRNSITLLDDRSRTFTTAPTQPLPYALMRWLASLSSREAVPTKPADLVIETTTVRTGESRQAFGFAARRVITTRRHIPVTPAGGARSEVLTDGWYIDLETALSCEETAAAASHAVLIVNSTPGAAGRRRDRPVVSFKPVGKPERGFPIEVSTTYRSAVAAPDGVVSEHTSTTRKEVTAISREVLDPSLFEPPADFRDAEGRLARLAARWARVLASLTN